MLLTNNLSTELSKSTMEVPYSYAINDSTVQIKYKII